MVLWRALVRTALQGDGSGGLVVEAVNAIDRGSGEYAEGEQMSERVCDGRRGFRARPGRG